MIYFAYGSNLNMDAMKYRCPKAVPLRKFSLSNARLVFRGVADVVHEPGSACAGGLWRITDECLASLDRYEGVSSGMYRRVYVPLQGVKGEEELMFYVMNSTGVMPPSSGYLNTIRKGYRDFNIPMRSLNAALRASWDDKAPSHVERRRYMRAGRPRLAQVPAQKAGKTGSPTTGNLFGMKEESV